MFSVGFWCRKRQILSTHRVDWDGNLKWRRPQNEDELKNEDDLKNENNLENEVDLKNEDNLKNEYDLKNENDLKNEDLRRLKKT